MKSVSFVDLSSGGVWVYRLFEKIRPGVRVESDRRLASRAGE